MFSCFNILKIVIIHNLLNVFNNSNICIVLNVVNIVKMSNMFNIFIIANISRICSIILWSCPILQYIELISVQYLNLTICWNKSSKIVQSFNTINKYWFVFRTWLLPLVLRIMCSSRKACIHWHCSISAKGKLSARGGADKNAPVRARAPRT